MAIKKVIIISAETQKAQKALEDVNLTIEQQEDLIKDTRREIEKLEDLRNKTSKKDQNRIKEYNEKIDKSNQLLKRTKTRLQENKQERTKNNKVLKESVKQQRDLTGVLGIVDKQTGGLISSFQGFTGSIGGATKGLGLLTKAFIATGIGAFVLVVTSLTAAFTQSEEGQEKLQRGLKMMGAVVKNVMDAFADLGEGIIDAITKPQQAWKSFKDGFKKFISDPIGTVKEVYTEAKEAATDFIEETKKEVQTIDEVTKARQKAHHIERDLQVERAQANREINDIRLQAEDRENKTASERIALLRKAQEIEEDITQKEIQAKKLLIEAQETEMEQGKNTIQDKDKLAKLQAELINLDTKKLRSQRLLQTQITTAINQEKAEKQKKKEEEAKDLEEAQQKEKDRLTRIKEIQDEFQAMVDEEKAVTEEEKAELQKEKELAELEKLNATEEQKAKIVAYWNGQIEKGKDKDAITDKKRDKAVANAKMDIAKQSMALIGEIAGKGSAIGKAMAIGQATISGIEGVQNAFSTAQESPVTAVFPAYPFIQAGLAGAFSALQIQKIASTKADGKGATPNPIPSAGGGGAAAPTASIPPAFNVVGQGETSQLADAIGGQEQQPVQAYVVSNDVTTAQGLERNIVEGATI